LVERQKKGVSATRFGPRGTREVPVLGRRHARDDALMTSVPAIAVSCLRAEGDLDAGAARQRDPSRGSIARPRARRSRRRVFPAPQSSTPGCGRRSDLRPSSSFHLPLRPAGRGGLEDARATIFALILVRRVSSLDSHRASARSLISNTICGDFWGESWIRGWAPSAQGPARLEKLPRSSPEMWRLADDAPIER